MPYILHIESATTICSVALSKGNTLISSREKGGNYSHAELLTVFIDEVLMEAGIVPTELDAVSVSMGPGSYTGLRIGVSTAKGLCYAIGKPLIAVSTLQGMASGMSEKLRKSKLIIDQILLIPMIDAKRMEVYSAVFDSNLNQIRETQAEIINESSFSEFLEKNKCYFFGDGAEKCSEIINHPNAIFDPDFQPSSKFFVKISLQKFHNQQFEDVAYFEPFYLKDFVAGVPKVKGLH